MDHQAGVGQRGLMDHQAGVGQRESLAGRARRQEYRGGGTVGRTLAARESLVVDGRPAFPRLVVQVWTETLRNDELALILREGYGSVRAAWGRIVEGYQQAGMMRADVTPDHVARTMIACALGFIAQQSLFGPAPVEALRDGLRALTSMRDVDTAARGSQLG